jgi:Family of unknown function (DUF6399)
MKTKNEKEAYNKREKAARVVKEYEAAQKLGTSQRMFAQGEGIARSTLQYWLNRREQIDDNRVVVEFFESPEGLAILHRIVAASHFITTFVGAGGIRLVCQFLELSGLSRYVASSYGSQQKVSSAMEQEIINYSLKQRAELSQQMKPKEISVCQDETFHPEICMVAIEPVSNFILLEQYAEKRDEQSWNKAMVEAVKELPVNIVQSTGDEAKALVSHVKNGLKAHHSPDLFHVQKDLSKGTSAALAAKVRKAEKNYQQTKQQLEQVVAEQRAYQLVESGPGRPPDFEKRRELAGQANSQAEALLAKAKSHQEEVKSAIRAIGKYYHPFALESGQQRSAAEISTLLTEELNKIKAVARHASLPERCLKLIDKANRVVVLLVATIAFFHQTVAAKVEALALPSEIEQAIYQHLIPSCYIQIVAGKTANPEQRRALQETAQRLLTAADSSLSALDAKDRESVEAFAQECAELFQRSSSCVEGRNGQLSFRHHNLHKIRTKRLQALTAVHNYFIKRSDGSTAAERFFGTNHTDLFHWLLDRLSFPARPAKSHSLLNAA